jgi:hypothetical protein
MEAMLAMTLYAISGIFRHATLNEIFIFMAKRLTPEFALLDESN